jgi:hypothetical protein
MKVRAVHLSGQESTSPEIRRPRPSDTHLLMNFIYKVALHLLCHLWSARASGRFSGKHLDIISRPKRTVLLHRKLY